MENIKIVRCDPPHQRDFRVLINGEHRATFRSNQRFSRVGYDFQAPDGKSITGKRRSYGLSVTKSDFPKVVQEAIDLNTIPTLAQIERVRMIERAEKENRQRDDEIAARRHEMKRSLITEGLYYLLENANLDPERRNMAENLLKRYTASNWEGFF